MMLPSITLTTATEIDEGYLEACIEAVKEELPDQKFVISILKNIFDLANCDIDEYTMTRKEEISLYMSLREVGYDVHRIFDGDADWDAFKIECMRYIPLEGETSRKEGRLRKPGVKAPSRNVISSQYAHNDAKAIVMVLTDIKTQLHDIQTLLVRILKKGDEK